MSVKQKGWSLPPRKYGKVHCFKIVAQLRWYIGAVFGVSICEGSCVFIFLNPACPIIRQPPAVMKIRLPGALAVVFTLLLAQPVFSQVMVLDMESFSGEGETSTIEKLASVENQQESLEASLSNLRSQLAGLSPVQRREALHAWYEAHAGQLHQPEQSETALPVQTTAGGTRTFKRMEAPASYSSEQQEAWEKSQDREAALFSIHPVKNLRL